VISLGKYETRRCPKEFQDRITRMFGVNQFGDPHFKIVWGQSQFIRMGNTYSDKYGRKRVGYREKYQAHGMPCWVIMRWKPASAYGSPPAYYMHSYMPAAVHIDENTGRPYDDAEGFYVTGEYPWRGRYEVVQPLISKEFVDGKLKIEHFPLSHVLVDMVIPLLLIFQQLTLEERKAAQELAHQEEEKKKTEQISEMMMENLPRFWNPVSYSLQGCRTSLLDRKMEAIEKIWNNLSKGASRPVFSRGLAQGQRPAVAGYKS
jgi:hypothetical protein